MREHDETGQGKGGMGGIRTLVLCAIYTGKCMACMFPVRVHPTPHTTGLATLFEEGSRFEPCHPASKPPSWVTGRHQYGIPVLRERANRQLNANVGCVERPRCQRNNQQRWDGRTNVPKRRASTPSTPRRRAKLQRRCASMERRERRGDVGAA